jgi:alpha-L-rhamnosidase
MRNAVLALIRLAGILLGICGPAMSFALAPVHLQCEYQASPLGIDTQHPRFGWWITSSRHGTMQTACQVVVSSSLEKLRAEKYDLWDSGMKQTSESAHIVYFGKSLHSNMAVFWKVRVWDQDNMASEWSQPATFTTALFAPEDWKGKWIAATSQTSYTKPRIMYGFHALESAKQDVTKWVQIDLRKPTTILEIVLHSPNPPGFEQSSGFGFPIRFKVEASNDPTFSISQMIADHTGRDFPNPAGDSVEFSGPRAAFRYIRVTATKLWNRQSGPEPYCFALAELEVRSIFADVTRLAPVTSSDSVENGDWGRKRLVDGEYLSTTGSASEQGPANAAVRLKKDIEVNKKVKRATAFICGLGYYEFSINGKKVGDHVLDPGFTDFSKRALYVTYDVTKDIQKGINDLGILLGGGWFNLATPDLFGFEKAPWTASPRAKFQLEIEYSDGSKQVVTSDKTWMWSTGNISFNCVRGGETIDARKVTPTWKSVTTVDGPKGTLVSQQSPPIRVTASIKPTHLSEPEPGVYVFDLGTNIAGWATLTTKGKNGSKVTLEYNEALKPDGTVDMKHTSSHTYGRFQRDEFILNGHGQETFEPRFTYHGFRYVQVTGLTEKPNLDSLTGKWVTTDPQVAGSFECSNERVNLLQKLIVHSYLNNLHSIPTDCPQREKMGWMDDGCVDMETGFFNLDTPQFYRKWFNDMMDAQDANGHVTDIVPSSGWGRTRADGSPGEMADPWWGGAIVFAPWKIYQNYGDRRVIAEGYPAMKRYVDYLSSTAKGNVISWGLGDWLDDSAGGGGRRVPVSQTSTAAYFYGVTIISKVAHILSNQADEEKYRTLAAKIKATFNAKFLDTATGLYAKDSQTAQALPLTLGLAPLESKSRIVDRLVESIEGTRRGHISAGMVGSLYVFHALAENGRDDLAYNMLTKEEYPGWLHMANSGATALWEAWNGDGSYDHPTMGCVGFWLYQGLAGIRPDPAGPGFKKFVIKPYIPKDLTWVKSHYDSVHGRIESSWRRNGMDLAVELTIPPNTSATVYVPTGAAFPIRESLVEASHAEGVKFLRRELGFEVFQVGSGSYSFKSNLQAAGF